MCIDNMFMQSKVNAFLSLTFVCYISTMGSELLLFKCKFSHLDSYSDIGNHLITIPLETVTVQLILLKKYAN